MAITNAAYAWGGNLFGQLGIQTVDGGHSSPVVVVGPQAWTQVAGAMFASIGLDTLGQAWTWGNGIDGGLGNNTSASASSPVLVTGNHSFVSVAMGGNNTGVGSGQGRSMGYALKADGSAWAWGLNNVGQLGDQTTTNRSSPVLVVGGHSFVQIQGSLGTLSGGVTFAAARKADGSVWTWGFNNAGSLGGHATSSSPAVVVGAHSFVQIDVGVAFGMGLKADGSVWCWGDNGSGQLGNQSLTDRSSPVLVVGGHSFLQVAACGQTGAALKADGSVWTWGNAAQGSLGDQTTTNRSSPVLVVGNHSFVAITRGDRYCLARKADGSTWGWGLNTAGQLGNQTVTNRSSPVLVVGAFSFAQVTGGDTHSLALRASGTNFVPTGDLRGGFQHGMRGGFLN